jgi:UTP--glucose-1-phosphate uridylyltransferase
MPVRKAVIPAAGLGTRFLPASKAVPKVLLPVVDKPAVQYAVEEAVRAGITNICIVTSPGGDAVAEYFSPAPVLEKALEASGKWELLEEVRSLTQLADIDYVTQDEPLGLGHAVLVARDYVGDEPFAVALPDEIFDPAGSVLADMVGAFERYSASVIAVAEVPDREISLYGSIDPEPVSGDVMRVRLVVEKPRPSEAPSNLAVVGRYVLDPEAFEALAGLAPAEDGEIQLTEGLSALAQRGRLFAQLYRGRRWDVGNREGYLRAVVTLAAERADLGPLFRQFLREFRP